MPSRFSLQERKKIILLSTLIFLIVGAWSIFGPFGALKYYRVAGELKEVQTRNKGLTQANDNLRKEIIKLRTDPAYLEEVARKEFGLLKKNEVVYDFKPHEKRHH
ncbi:MAG: septum formation initiator family protein [Desulfobulbaceae bacterium]|nr:septum formation initiator family protein [Desulfobulbaceae bacterium]HIJ78187.1 septum formation initiator family protein [Deltaproteobacteria bacterium]